MVVSDESVSSHRDCPYLKLDLGLSDVLLTAVTAGNLLCLGDLAPHGLDRLISMPILGVFCS